VTPAGTTTFESLESFLGRSPRLIDRLRSRAAVLAFASAILVVIAAGIGWWRFVHMPATVLQAERAWGEGNQLIEQRELDKALAAYDHAIKLVPSFTLAYIGRGGAHLALRAYDKAFADYNTAIARSPDSPEAFFARGTLYWLLNELP